MQNQGIIYNHNIMITRQIKTMSWEKPYVSPEIHTLEIKSEGMLCLSFGDANMAGKMLKEDDDFTWNF